MIKDFLIINCTGKNDSIGLKLDNNFFIEKLQTNIKNNELLVDKIFNLLQKKKAKVNNSFSVIVNIGPGSFSTLRTSLAIAKGIKISKGSCIYGYKNSILKEFNLKNIEFLIEKNLIENELIKPVYLS